MNLAAGTAGAGVTHGPEVFFQTGNGVDAFLWHAFGQPTLTGRDIKLPGVPGGNVRAAKNRFVELLLRNPKPLGRRDQFPSVSNRIFCEIIDEGKIAED